MEAVAEITAVPDTARAPSRGSGDDDWDVGGLLAEMLGGLAGSGELQTTPGGADARERVMTTVNRAIAAVDDLLGAQVNEILHAPAFQRLEASWLGLRHLVDQADAGDGVRVRVLTVTWQELSRDVVGAIEFDRSELFHKVYDEEFGMPGGEPFGLLVGDYEVSHRPQDVATLAAVSRVAAAAFAPFVAAAHPALLGVEDFRALSRHPGPPVAFDAPEYAAWRSFRDTEDARFVGLALPRVLMRLPYGDGVARRDGFRFRERSDGADGSGYLWGSAAYAFGGVVIRAFASSHWPADLRGVRRGGPGEGPERGGGLVIGLPAPSFATDAPGVAVRGLTDVCLTDQQEKAYGDVGLIPLCQLKGTGHGAFFGNQSAQRPPDYVGAGDAANARMGAMLQYIVCASRFAHYLKAIGRDRLGASAEAGEWQDALSVWLGSYTTDDARASAAVKAAFPLRRSAVSVREIPGKPGAFACDVLLMPHYQLDELSGSIVLKTELKPVASR